QEGPYVLVRTPPGDKPYVRKNWTYELRDFRAKSVIWSRHFLQDSPVVSWTTDHDAILMGWHVYSDAAHEELKQFSDLKSSAEKEDMLYELLDLRSNTTIGKLLVKTNKSSFFVTSAAVERDWAALSVSGNRVLIYSISSGKETGHVFGYSPVLSQAAGAYAVSTAEGTVGVYSLSTSQLRRSYKFPISVLYKKFSPDGKRLLVVTRDQTVYILDLTFPDEVVSDTPRPPSILSR
ncbi:MAG: WD40 repeat domain-containing protein, partial [Candidatus Sulfotelmatobacter sp.]